MTSPGNPRRKCVYENFEQLPFINHLKILYFLEYSSLPYTEAVIMEVMRYSTLLPMGVLHRMLKGRTFHGYYLPKDTVIVPNLYACHHNPEIWGDPENFRPERFLSEDGSKVIRNEAFMPFSAGRRVCLGKPNDTLSSD